MQISEVKICQFRAKKTSSTVNTTVYELSVFLSYFSFSLLWQTGKNKLSNCIEKDLYAQLWVLLDFGLVILCKN